MSEEFFDRITKASRHPFVKKFNIAKDPPIPKVTYISLLDLLEKTHDNPEYRFLGGASIVTVRGEQIIMIARTKRIAGDFDIVEEIVNDLDVEVFINALPDKIVHQGLGYMKFEYFEKYWARIVDGFCVVYQVIEEEKKMEKRLNKNIKELKKILELIPSTQENGQDNTEGDIEQENGIEGQELIQSKNDYNQPKDQLQTEANMDQDREVEPQSVSYEGQEDL